MSYKITIEKTRTVTRKAGKDWAVVGKKEIERESRFHEPNAPKTIVVDAYDYTPEVEKQVVEKVEVLTQTVDDLNLPAVIKAINNL